MSEKIFAEGIRLFPKHEKAPAFVKGQLVITLNQFVKFCKDNPGYLTDYNGEKQIKLTLQETKDGKLIAVVDTWKKEEIIKPKNEATSDLPF